MKFNADKFLFLYSNQYGKMSESQQEGIIKLITLISNDTKLGDLRWVAYMLATTKHETAGMWQPIAEYGKGKGKKYGTPDPETGKIYYGRGFVQLTWKDNYATMGKIFALDFVNNPELVMNFDHAYNIMSYGMRKGSFTGVGLPKYINDNECDYTNARKIINGLDCASKITGYALLLEQMLMLCRE